MLQKLISKKELRSVYGTPHLFVRIAQPKAAGTLPSGSCSARRLPADQCRAMTRYKRLAKSAVENK